MGAKSIVRLKITLDRVEPTVMRRITVRLGVRLGRLHRIVQAAMGWSGGHLWEFRAGGIGWGPREDYELGDGPHDASKATLLSVFQDVGGKSIRYVYDFGDDWQHTIKLERTFADVPGLAQPFLLEAIGRCPPEDIGGPQGYREMLDTLADPKHARHNEFFERHGSFDPAVVDLKVWRAQSTPLPRILIRRRRRAGLRPRASRDHDGPALYRQIPSIGELIASPLGATFC